jgi:hypothetical protein
MIKIKREPRRKQKTCSVRRTHPIGPITLCEKYCLDFEPCIKLTKREKEAGLDKIKGPYTALKNDIDPKGRFCSMCGKAIARPETVFRNFKGMFVIHMQHKHIILYGAYKRGEVYFEDLYHSK